jgi:hypothetical protein
MKQRGKRSNSKLVHVSFDEVERFVPRVPKQICPDEDNTTPRICVAPNILSAIQAMPQGGTVAYNMARIGVPVVIHAYYIESNAILMPEQIADKVPDAVATGEMWVMAVPAAVRRIDYEIVDPYVPMRIDRNGTRERFLVWYGELKPFNITANLKISKFILFARASYTDIPVKSIYLFYYHRKLCIFRL